jgi:hypothetical protein
MYCADAGSIGAAMERAIRPRGTRVGRRMGNRRSMIVNVAGSPDENLNEPRAKHDQI